MSDFESPARSPARSVRSVASSKFSPGSTTTSSLAGSSSSISGIQSNVRRSTTGFTSRGSAAAARDNSARKKSSSGTGSGREQQIVTLSKSEPVWNLDSVSNAPLNTFHPSVERSVNAEHEQSMLMMNTVHGQFQQNDAHALALEATLLKEERLEKKREDARIFDRKTKMRLKGYKNESKLASKEAKAVELRESDRLEKNKEKMAKWSRGSAGAIPPREGEGKTVIMSTASNHNNNDDGRGGGAMEETSTIDTFIAFQEEEEEAINNTHNAGENGKENSRKKVTVAMKGGEKSLEEKREEARRSLLAYKR
jgi:hypothetical protein